jgi:signal transduction histidine kinase
MAIRMTPRTVPPLSWGQTLVVLVAVGLGLWMLISSAQSGPPEIGTILAVLVGWSFVACGTFLWARRRGVRLGQMMVAFGGLWLLGRSLLLVSQPVLFTAGMWISDLSAAAFALFLLSYPSGRIASRIDRAIAVIFLFVSIPLEFVWLLFLELEGGLNVLAIAPNATAAQVVDAVQRSALALGAVLLIGSVGHRWLRSSGPVRPQSTPVLVGALAILLASASWILQPFGITLPQLNNLVLAAQIATPIAILAVLLRARMARPLRDFVIELGQTPAPARLRDALAHALGDPSLQVAYWSPTRQRFEDPAGEPVELPETDAGQAVTELERGGVQEAVIIHDPILLDDPGLMASVAGALRLAVANDRLTAEVRTQLEEVRASRARIVEAGDLERRRVERDLHDGAQQRLISLSLELRVARNALGDDADPAVKGSLERAADEATAALAELRDLALGIHPLILTESGLGAAVESLADRSPVDVAVDIGHERYPTAVEGAAYFVISEALANVAKYANATKARVRVRPFEEHMTIEVEDDGVGGADPRSGSGLSGLRDRLAALDGTMTIDSPSGGGTRLSARIPTNQTMSA